ncbi:LuxR family transcriptional regulator [Streptomyces sp. SGAir0957]
MNSAIQAIRPDTAAPSTSSAPRAPSTPSTPSAPSPSEPVDEFTMRVYEYVLGHDAATPETIATALDAPAHPVKQALHTLRGLRLLKDPAGGGREIVAVHPEAAQLELLLPLENAIRDQRHRLAGVKGQLRAFMEVFDNTRRHRETVVSTDDQSEITLRLQEAAQHCTSEILLMQPCVTREPSELVSARPLIIEALRRGVEGRVLYPHTARSDAGTRSYALRLAEADGQVRTSRDVHARFLVFDRKTAFVMVEDDNGGPNTITIVYEPSLAMFLGSLHDLTWQSAFPLQQGTHGYAGTLNDLRATIVELLASGIKDEVIARRVGLSERSFRRHVAAIMQDLAAGSRFQAGVMAARAGLVGHAAESPVPLPPATTPGRAA